MNDFHNIRNAKPDKDGFIEAILVPLRGLVLYPNMVTPLFIGRERTLEAIKEAQKQGKTVIGVGQLDPDQNDPTPDDLYSVGTEIALGRLMKMPDNSISVLAQGRRRVKVVEITKGERFLMVKARPIQGRVPRSPAVDGLMRAVTTMFEKCIQINRNLPEEALIYAMNISEPGWLADLIISTLNLSLDERQEFLELFDSRDRLARVSEVLGRELNVLEIEEEINAQVQMEADRNQREAYLREQMRVIQNELGEGDPFQQDVDELRRKIETVGMPPDIQTKATKELDRLAMMPPMAPEVGIIRTYVDWLVELPWTKATEDKLDITYAAKVLEEDHFGLPKAKERILEHIAVRKLAPEKMKSPILCFVGPPGTGKTSLGRSIAKALGREFVRVSLGGVRDEAEIRGHRRTYIGALPGRVLQTIRRAGTINPVFMLDEIDKLGQDFRGDPASALLEVLDPEQNYAFSDHYLEVPYDLSKVMFVTTANSLDPIPPALLDRMEVIEFSGYTEEEKLEIARRFILLRQMEQHGLPEGDVHFEEAAIRGMIREYTYEAGVRNLDRQVATICRKLARRLAEGKRIPKKITAETLSRYLGPAEFLGSKAEDHDQVGVVTGVAWTEGGGDIMPIEVTLMNGKGTLTLTGQLGDVMQESIQASMSYMRSRAKDLGIKEVRFDKTDIHVHLPEAAVHKDGPSAGITIATALISAFTRRKAHSNLTLTGEITLRGRVLPVGGIKEKLLAAHRAGIRRMIIPERNQKDLVHIPKKVLAEMTIFPVTTMDEVLRYALYVTPDPAPLEKPARKPRAAKKPPTNGEKKTPATKRTPRKRPPATPPATAEG
ncbi:MAG: endopeptidase La [Anaerolineales bacterium]|nr:endopeptidase La [Anaerolineales bacterium]